MTGRDLLLAGLAGVMLAGVSAPPAPAGGIDALEAAAIDDPAALEKMAADGKMTWLPSTLSPRAGGETVDWEGGGLVASTTTSPAGRYSPTDQDKRRGYAVFPWHYMVRMLPQSRPQQALAGEGLALAAAPGEYEPAAFGVLPLEDLKGVVVAAGPLRRDGGGEIPSSALRLSWVRFIPQRLRGDQETWGLGPAVLSAMKETDIPAGCARGGWLTVQTPETAAPGLYRGFLEVRVKGRRSARLEVALRVRPIRLGPAEPVTYAHYYSVPADDGQMVAEMTAAREHGSTSFSAHELLHGRARADPNGHVTSVDFSRADRFMQQFKRLGFRGPVPLLDLLVQGHNTLTDSTGEYFLIKKDRHEIGGEAFFRCMREIVSLIRDHARQAGWPEVYMYSSSELSRYRDVQGELIPFGIRLIKEMKSVGGVKVCASINGPDEPRFVRYDGPGELAFLDHLDVVMYNYGVPINDRTLAAAHARKGLRLWFQNIGTGRFTEGLMLWRAGAVGRRQYRLDGRLTEAGLVAMAGIFYRSPTGLLPTTNWECMREGVDDMRYIRTAQRAIEQAGKQADPRLKALTERFQQRLEQIKASIRIDMSRESVRRGQRPEWRPLRLYDEFRDELAGMIQRLSPGQQPSTTNPPTPRPRPAERPVTSGGSPGPSNMR